MGFFDFLKGPSGVSIKTAKADANGLMTLTLSDDTVQKVQLPPGKDGAYVSGASIVNGKLILQFSDETEIDAGNVVGATGPSGKDAISIKTATADANGLMTVTLSDNTVLPKVQLPPGKDGIYVKGASIVNGKLILQMSDDTKIDTGNVIGATGAIGRGINNVSINTSGNLIVKMSDNSEIDAGKVTGIAGKNGISIINATANDTGLMTLTLSDGITTSTTTVQLPAGKDGLPGLIPDTKGDIIVPNHIYATSMSATGPATFESLNTTKDISGYNLRALANVVAPHIISNAGQGKGGFWIGDNRIEDSEDAWWRLVTRGSPVAGSQVYGKGFAASKLYAAGEVYGKTLNTGDATVTGSATVGTLKALGNIWSAGTLTVGNSATPANLDVYGNITVGTDTKPTNLTVKGNTVTGDISGNKLNARWDITSAGDVTATKGLYGQTLTTKGDATVGGALNTTGNANIGGALNIGDATFAAAEKDYINLTGPSSAPKRFAASTLHSRGDINAEGNATINGTLKVGGIGYKKVNVYHHDGASNGYEYCRLKANNTLCIGAWKENQGGFNCDKTNAAVTTNTDFGANSITTNSGKVSTYCMDLGF